MGKKRPSREGGNAQLLVNIPPDKRGRIHKNDVQRLKELGNRLNATFALNLAAGASSHRRGTVPIGNQAVKEGQPPSGTDGDSPSFRGWRSDFVYELDLHGPKRFNVAMVKENLLWGQRIESFTLDAWDGNAWKEIAQGTTVGWKKLLRFPAVESSKVRVRLVSSRGGLSFFTPESFGLFLDPGR